MFQTLHHWPLYFILYFKNACYFKLNCIIFMKSLIPKFFWHVINTVFWTLKAGNGRKRSCENLQGMIRRHFESKASTRCTFTHKFIICFKLCYVRGYLKRKPYLPLNNYGKTFFFSSKKSPFLFSFTFFLKLFKNHPGQILFQFFKWNNVEHREIISIYCCFNWDSMRLMMPLLSIKNINLTWPTDFTTLTVFQVRYLAFSTHWNAVFFGIEGNTAMYRRLSRFCFN